MGAEYKKLITLSEVVDTDTGQYETGEIGGMCADREIKKYLESHGEKGYNWLKDAFTHLIYLNEHIFRELPEKVRFPDKQQGCTNTKQG